MGHGSVLGGALTLRRFFLDRIHSQGKHKKTNRARGFFPLLTHIKKRKKEKEKGIAGPLDFSRKVFQ